MDSQTSASGSPSKRPAHARSRSAGVVLKSLVSPSKKDAQSPTKRSREETSERPDRPDRTASDLLISSKKSDGQPVNPFLEQKSRLRKASSPAKPQKTELAHEQSPRKARPLSGFNVFGKQKSLNVSPSKDQPLKDKENQTPPQTADIEPRTPIWSEFTSQQWQKNPTSAYKPEAAQRVSEDGPTWRSPQKHQPPSKPAQDVSHKSAPRHSPVKSQKHSSHRGCTAADDSKPAELSRASPTKTQLSSDTASKRPAERLGGYNPACSVDPNRQLTDKTPAQASKTLEDDRPRSHVPAAVAIPSGDNVPSRSLSLLKGRELDEAFEAMLTTRNIVEPTRSAMRSLDIRVKNELVRQDAKPAPTALVATASSPKKSGSWNDRPSPTKSPSKSRRKREADDGDANTDDESCPSPSKRSRSRSRTWTLTKRDKPAPKRNRSGSRTRNLMSLKNFSSSSVNSMGYDGAKDSKESNGQSSAHSDAHLSTTGVSPTEYVQYLNSYTSLESIEVGRLQRLRRLIRNETVAWVTHFINLGGMSALTTLLVKIMDLEWREEHEDLLLHEALRCVKSLCTTELALQKLECIHSSLLPRLLKMLFDDERRGPSEFNTRAIIIELLFVRLSSAPLDLREFRALELLGYLQDPKKTEQERPVGFVECMSKPRPYTNWCREVSNTTKEVFWIFIHHSNMIEPASLTPRPSAPDQDIYAHRHFPRPRPAVPSAPHVGGPEFDATNYLAAHLDLLNGLLASLPTAALRNKTRDELRDSGFEKVMGGSLRTCKEKFYGCVHDGLSTWVGAAREDGWDAETVQRGPVRSPIKSSVGAGAPPKLELPVLALGEKREPWL
ncbi:MAG: hypothetical protein M1828_002276 [Chrysothrix sp. TS-e1954]|nr:MAG: hypothetical protein M1828_002276 [Chrysothrix sp. TS-e1954]